MIAIYDTKTPDWRMVRSMCSPSASSLDDLIFAPLAESPSAPLIAWESPVLSSRIFVFAPDGQSCRVIEDVKSKAQTSLLDSGFERLVWAPCGWLAVAVRDNHSIAVWNSIIQKMSINSIEVGPLSVLSGETVLEYLDVNKQSLDCLQGAHNKRSSPKRNSHRSI